MVRSDIRERPLERFPDFAALNPAYLLRAIGLFARFFSSKGSDRMKFSALQRFCLRHGVGTFAFGNYCFRFGPPARYCIISALSFLAAIAFLASASKLVANETLNSICANKVEQFVKDLDEVLVANPDSVFVVTAVVRKYLPVDGCNVEEIISISKRSKFFYDAYEQFAFYTISFRSSRFIVSFGLRKKNGDIEFPAARVILPRPYEQRTSVDYHRGG